MFVSFGIIRLHSKLVLISTHSDDKIMVSGTSLLGINALMHNMLNTYHIVDNFRGSLIFVTNQARPPEVIFMVL